MRSCRRPAAAALLLTAAMAWPQQTGEKKPIPPPDTCPLATTDIARTNCPESLANKADTNLTTLYRGSGADRGRYSAPFH